MDRYFLKFYKWLYSFSKKQFRKYYKNVNHNDIKCPGCLEWFSLSSAEHEHEKFRNDDKDYWVMTCGKCKTKSNWNGSMFPFLVRVDFNCKPLDISILTKENK